MTPKRLVLQSLGAGILLLRLAAFRLSDRPKHYKNWSLRPANTPDAKRLILKPLGAIGAFSSLAVFYAKNSSLFKIYRDN